MSESIGVTIRPGMKMYQIEPFRGGDITEYEVLEQVREGKTVLRLHVVGAPDWDAFDIPENPEWEKYIGEIYFLTRDDATAAMNARAEEYRTKIGTKEALLKNLFNGTVDENWTTADMNVLAQRIKEEFGVDVLERSESNAS